MERHDAPPDADAAALAAIFYDLFPDVTPQGSRDLAYFKSLADDFGTLLDVDEQLKRFAAWTLDRDMGATKSPRASLRNWLSNARTYRLRDANRRR